MLQLKRFFDKFTDVVDFNTDANRLIGNIWQVVHPPIPENQPSIVVDALTFIKSQLMVRLTHIE